MTAALLRWWTRLNGHSNPSIAGESSAAKKDDYLISAMNPNFFSSFKMVEAFQKLVDDENIIRVFDLKNPEAILNSTLSSIDKTVEKKLETITGPPRR